MPVRSIRLVFDLRGATEERLVSALHLTELYCVVYRTLVGGVPISVPG